MVNVKEVEIPLESLSHNDSSYVLVSINALVFFFLNYVIFPSDIYLQFFVAHI